MERVVHRGATGGPKLPPDVLQALSPALAPFAPARLRSCSGREEAGPRAEIGGAVVASAAPASARCATLQKEAERGLETQEQQLLQLVQGLQQQLQHMWRDLDAQGSQLESLGKKMAKGLDILEGPAATGSARRLHHQAPAPTPPGLPTAPDALPEVPLWGPESPEPPLVLEPNPPSAQPLVTEHLRNQPNSEGSSCAATPCRDSSGYTVQRLHVPDRAFPGLELQSASYSEFCSSSSDSESGTVTERANLCAAEFDVFTTKTSKWRTSSSSIDPRSHAVEIHKDRAKNGEVMVPFGIFEILVSSHAYWEGIVEPQRKGRLVAILHRCQPFVLAVIVFNAFWIAWVVNYEAEHLSQDLPGHVRIVEAALLAVYTVELALRIAVHRAYFFCNDEMGWNLLDLILAAYGFLELTVHFFENHWSFLRATRIFKASKVLRILRAIKFLHPVRLMLACLLGSLTSLFWSLFLTLVILYIFSIIFVQAAVFYERTHSAVDEPLTEFFGTLPRSLLSLFIIVTGGNDWYEYYAAIGVTGPFYSGIFMFFVAFSQIALLNVVAAVFVEKALKLAEPTFEQKALKLADEELEIRTHLLHLLKSEFGLEPTDDLPAASFFRELHGTKFIRYLHFIGVRLHEVVHLMERTGALGGSKTTKVKEFVSGCMKARGVATSMKLQHLLYEIRHMSLTHRGLLGRIHRGQRQYLRGRKGRQPETRSSDPS